MRGCRALQDPSHGSAATDLLKSRDRWVPITTRSTRSRSELSLAKPCPATLCASSTASPDGGTASSPSGSSPSWPAATWGLIHFENPLIWIPLALVQGFTVFNFTILLHEVVHHTVFDRPPSAGRAHARVTLRDSERHLAEPVHALASRPSRGAGIGRGGSRSGTTSRRRSTSAGTSCSTARRRCSRSTSAPRAANR